MLYGRNVELIVPKRLMLEADEHGRECNLRAERRIETQGKDKRLHTSAQLPNDTPEAALASSQRGARGELAFAIADERVWLKRIDTYKTLPDFDPNIEVRTRSKWRYDLIVRDNDEPSRIFVHVFELTLTDSYRYVFRGWLRGKDAERVGKRANYGGGRESWFVESSKLNAFPTPDRIAAPIGLPAPALLLPDIFTV